MVTSGKLIGRARENGTLDDEQDAWVLERDYQGTGNEVNGDHGVQLPFPPNEPANST